MSTSQKRALAHQIEEMRRQSAILYRERTRLEGILANYDTAPLQPVEKVLSVYIRTLPDGTPAETTVPIVRHGDRWYVFLPVEIVPLQFQWEELCTFLHDSQHRGLVTGTTHYARDTILPGNIA